MRIGFLPKEQVRSIVSYRRTFVYVGEDNGYLLTMLTHLFRNTQYIIT